MSMALAARLLALEARLDALERRHAAAPISAPADRAPTEIASRKATLRKSATKRTSR